MKSRYYEISTWDEYSRFHLSVLTSMQWALFNEAITYLKGDVVDLGCGTARLAPLLKEKININSYTGVDYSPEMVKMAQWVISNLKSKSFKIIHEKIENISGCFDSAVSIHSFYSWQDTSKVLSCIYNMLKTNGTLTLATPNPDMDMKLLLKESEKELMGHPDFEIFKKINLELAGRNHAKFLTMDQLIDESHHVGFKTIECNSNHYLNGVNLIVFKK